MEVGQYNPLLGEGYGELAAESRSMHKSQGFGTAATRGPATEYFKYLKGDSAKTDLFEGINLTWNRIDGGTAIGKLTQKAINTFDPQYPEKTLPLLEQIHHLLNGRTDHYSELKRKQVEDLMLQVTGTYVEALSTQYSNTPGVVPDIVVSVLSRNKSNIMIGSVRLNVPFGESKNGPFNSDPTVYKTATTAITDTFFALIPNNYPYTTQYWLRYPHGIAMYTVKDQNLIGQAENTDPITASFDFKAGNESFTITKPVLFKWVDPVQGEKYRQFEVLPRYSIVPDSKVVMLPNGQPKPITIKVQSKSDTLAETKALGLPDGKPATDDMLYTKKGEPYRLSFVSTPVNDGSGAVITKIVGIDKDNHRDSSYVEHIDHPHIPIQVVVRPSEVKLVPVDIKMGGKNIGYIPGAGDEVPKSLQDIGYNVTVLNDNQIETSDLSKFDAIVTGVRAYNVNDNMAKHYNTLMNYIKNGGTLLVQYNTFSSLSKVYGQIGPYPFKLSNTRVTNENAPVTFTDPNSPVLNTPNKITQADFSNWVQERGIYFATDMDSHYQTPFEMNDPGEKPAKGSLIIAPYGKGYFIYTGLDFFRELPAGVPGAYRLMANLLAL
jgi:hypothetical protein